MPLHPEGERVVDGDDGFDHPVVGPATCHQRACGPHGLVVRAVHVDLGSEPGVSGWLHTHPMGGLSGVVGLLVGDALRMRWMGRWKVLDEGAPGRDRQHLHAAAHAEQGHAVGEAAGGQGQLEGRARRLHPVEASSDRFSVQAGVDVHVAAGEDHSVGQCEQSVDVADPRRHDEWQAPGVLHGLNVGFVHPRLGPLGANAPVDVGHDRGGLRDGTVSADEDDRTGLEHAADVTIARRTGCPMHETLTLARLPTPLHRLDRLSPEVGAELWVKRDDLTGFGLSGNKVRKLDLLLSDAVDQGADTVITCGGLQSNHCRATTIAARQVGLEPVLLLRGERPSVSDGNLLLDDLVGARVHLCSAETYRTRRTERMEELASALRAEGRVPYVIPEGGSNGLGALGFARAATELLEQAEPFDAVFVAVGSGGTLAGLALGPDIGPLRGVAVCDDRDTFVGIVERIGREAESLGALPLPAVGERWDVLEAYRGPAYGVATASTWGTIRRAARTEGLLLDPTYTGKAFEGMLEEIAVGRVAGRVLFWHTGGAFGLFGRGDEAL